VHRAVLATSANGLFVIILFVCNQATASKWWVHGCNWTSGRASPGRALCVGGNSDTIEGLQPRTETFAGQTGQCMGQRITPAPFGSNARPLTDAI
jgi:hypothetical protein